MRTVHLEGDFRLLDLGADSPAVVSWEVEVWSEDLPATRSPGALAAAVDEAVQMLLADDVPQESIKVVLHAEMEWDEPVSCLLVAGSRPATEEEVETERTRRDDFQDDFLQQIIRRQRIEAARALLTVLEGQ